jgi:hypothetical protein
MDPAKAHVTLDIGPATDSAEAAQFRQFWGDKAETWRLKVIQFAIPFPSYLVPFW